MLPYILGPQLTTVGTCLGTKYLLHRRLDPVGHASRAPCEALGRAGGGQISGFDRKGTEFEPGLLKGA